MSSCLDDDWRSDLRHAAMEVMQALLISYLKDLQEKQLLDVYPELLKRLDDSNDDLRIYACELL